MKTRIYTLLLAMMTNVIMVNAENGICGENLTWDLTDSVLTISGIGEMMNYERLFDFELNTTKINSPWYSKQSYIKSIVIADGVTRIGNNAFSDCVNLNSVNIPNSIKSIGNRAFFGCTNLAFVHISDIAAWCNINFNDAYANPLQFAKHLYVDNTEVIDLIIPNGVTKIRECAFYQCHGFKSVIIPNSVRSIGKHAFFDCHNVTSITLGNSIDSICYGAFQECRRVSHIKIPESVTYIGSEAFFLCENMISVELPDNTKEIGSNAFCECSSLQSINIPENLTSIEQALFASCSSLSAVILPEKISRIDYMAFANCTNLKTLIIKAETPPTLGENVFKNSNITNIYVPCGTKERYTKADGWKQQESIITYSKAPYVLVTLPENAGTIETPENATICDSAILLTAKANYGFRFIKWSDDTTNNSRIVQVTNDTTFTAIFAKNPAIKYVFDSEKGVVEGDTILANSAADSVTFTAIPKYGYYFVGWQDGNTENPRTIFLDKDTTFIALFGKTPIIKYIYDKAAGFVCGDTTLTNSAAGNVTMKVLPAYGYRFVKWSDGNTENPRTIYLTQDTTFAVEFELNQYELNVIYDKKHGHVEGNSGTFGYSSEHIMTAIPNYGYHFDHWNDTIIYDLANSILPSDAYSIASTFTANQISQGTYLVLGYVTGVYSYKAGNSWVWPQNSYWLSDTPDSQGIFVVYNGNQKGQGRVVAKCQLKYFRFSVAENADGVELYNITDADTCLVTVGQSSETIRTITLQGKTHLEAVFTPNKYAVSVSSANTKLGSVTPTNGNYDYLSEIELTASPKYGYTFVRWSDGNTENPRNLILTRDTALVAEFTIANTGNCGDEMVLKWGYDSIAKILTISGDGSLNSNYTFGLQAPENVEILVIAEGVTTIGNRAFAEYTTLKQVSIATTVSTIYEQAFYNCSGLKQIFSYREKPANAYSNTFDGIDKSECTLHVLSTSTDIYSKATGWRDFYNLKTIDAGEVTTQADTVIIVPTDNTAEITWPVVEGAESYEILITKDGNKVCSLIFNAQGQLIGIAFASAHNKSQKQQTKGFRFTVTGLNGGTQYGYIIAAKDTNAQTVDTKSGTFKTTGTATEIENVQRDNVQGTKVLRDGQMYILRGEKMYDARGVEVK